jgi:hypothetical protein
VPESSTLIGPLSTQDPVQFLIEEARHRQRTRRRFAVAVTLFAFLAGSLAYLVLDARSASGPNSTTPGGSPVFVLAGRFAGAWHVHTYYVYLRSDGRGSAKWPIHTYCGTGPGEGPSPCDRLVPTLVTLPDGAKATEQTVIDGGHATLRLTSVGSNTAHGIVTGSTEPSLLPDGPATFRLTKKDLLYVTPRTWPSGPSPFRGSGLCGNRAAALSVSQQVAAGVNCG